MAENVNYFYSGMTTPTFGISNSVRTDNLGGLQVSFVNTASPVVEASPVTSTFASTAGFFVRATSVNDSNSVFNSSVFNDTVVQNYNNGFGTGSGLTSVAPAVADAIGVSGTLGVLPTQSVASSIFLSTAPSTPAGLQSSINMIIAQVNRPSFDVSGNPEPSTFVLLGSGLLAVGYYRRKRAQA